MSRISVLALFAALMAAATGCGGDGNGDEALRGAVRAPAPVTSDIVLADAAAGGAPFALQAAPGRLLAVYFGYTSCPDICPTTMADLRSARDDLGERADRVDVGMITVDPDRDTAEVLAAYVQHFFPTGHALRAPDEATLRAAADRFGADYQVSVDPGTGNPEVAHTAFLYVVDDSGAMQVQWAFGTDWRDMAHDLSILLDRSDERN